MSYMKKVEQVIEWCHNYLSLAMGTIILGCVTVGCVHYLLTGTIHF